MMSVVMLISRLRRLHPGDAFQILLARVSALHGFSTRVEPLCTGRCTWSQSVGYDIDGFDDVLA